MKKQFISAAIAVLVTMTVSAPLTVSADEWVKIDSGYVYEYDNGTNAESGWLKIDGKTYYIKKDGTRQTGWLKTKTAKYYFDKNGVMQKSKWITMKSGAKYYLRKDGKSAVDCTLKIDGENYTFDSDGKLVTENKEISLKIGINDFKKSIDLSEYSSNDDETLYVKDATISNLPALYIYNFDNNKLQQHGYAVSNESGNYNKLKKHFTSEFNSKPTYSNKNGCYWKTDSNYFCIYYSDDYIFAVHSTKQLVEKKSANNTTTSTSQSKTVYVTKTGKKYHYSNSCNGGTYYASTLDAAVSRGLKPCEKCVG
ncbi:MAG: hypothetical protein K2N26_03280 [Oscillospiraceae bacterium]|nr:hypothetical protein [Oscillospiraceae bacterium]MDE7278732.1 hypothetical protein [Oscillospiraceae bacterium]